MLIPTSLSLYKKKVLVNFLVRITKKKNHRRLPAKFLVKNSMGMLFNYGLKFYGDFYGNMDKFNIKLEESLKLNYLQVLYQQLYFCKLFGFPVYYKAVNSYEALPKDILYYMVFASRKLYWKRFDIIHGNEVIETLLISLWFKDLGLFMKWVRKFFEKCNLKRHKKMFLLLDILLGRLIWHYNIFFNLKGLRVILRGKFGKAGSVRKTRRYIRRGKCSYTTKSIGIVESSTVIRTYTGVFGIKMEVFFSSDVYIWLYVCLSLYYYVNLFVITFFSCYAYGVYE